MDALKSFGDENFERIGRELGALGSKIDHKHSLVVREMDDRFQTMEDQANKKVESLRLVALALADTIRAVAEKGDQQLSDLKTLLKGKLKLLQREATHRHVELQRQLESLETRTEEERGKMAARMASDRTEVSEALVATSGKVGEALKGLLTQQAAKFDFVDRRLIDFSSMCAQLELKLESEAQKTAQDVSEKWRALLELSEKTREHLAGTIAEARTEAKAGVTLAMGHAKHLHDAMSLNLRTTQEELIATAQVLQGDFSAKITQLAQNVEEKMDFLEGKGESDLKIVREEVQKTTDELVARIDKNQGSLLESVEGLQGAAAALQRVQEATVRRVDEVQNVILPTLETKDRTRELLGTLREAAEGRLTALEADFIVQRSDLSATQTLLEQKVVEMGSLRRALEVLEADRKSKEDTIANTNEMVQQITKQVELVKVQADRLEETIDLNMEELKDKIRTEKEEMLDNIQALGDTIHKVDEAMDSGHKTTQNQGEFLRARLQEIGDKIRQVEAKVDGGSGNQGEVPSEAFGQKLEKLELSLAGVKQWTQKLDTALDKMQVEMRTNGYTSAPRNSGAPEPEPEVDLETALERQKTSIVATVMDKVGATLSTMNTKVDGLKGELVQSLQAHKKQMEGTLAEAIKSVHQKMNTERADFHNEIAENVQYLVEEAVAAATSQKSLENKGTKTPIESVNQLVSVPGPSSPPVQVPSQQRSEGSGPKIAGVSDANLRDAWLQDLDQRVKEQSRKSMESGDLATLRAAQSQQKSQQRQTSMEMPSIAVSKAHSNLSSQSSQNSMLAPGKQPRWSGPSSDGRSGSEGKLSIANPPDPNNPIKRNSNK